MTTAYEKAKEIENQSLRLNTYIEELNKEFAEQIEGKFELRTSVTSDNRFVINNEWIGEWELGASFFFNERGQFVYEICFYCELTEYAQNAEERKIHEIVTEELKQLFPEA